MSETQQFSYAEWLYHMDGGDEVWGNIVYWANTKGWSLPDLEQQQGLRRLEVEEFKS